MNLGKEARIYSPAEDTMLLLDAARHYEADRVLEIGIGSGAVVSRLAERSRLVVGVDVDPAAVRRAKESITSVASHLKADFVCGDSATLFRDAIFDLVIFNPPYLPSVMIEDLAVDGGSRGIEVSLFWFREASRCLGEGGRIVFIVSTLSDIDGLFESVRGFGFEIRVLSRTRLFFEELSVVEARRL